MHILGVSIEIECPPPIVWICYSLESLEDKNETLEDKNQTVEEKNETLKEKNGSLEGKNKSLEDKNTNSCPPD